MLLAFSQNHNFPPYCKFSLKAVVIFGLVCLFLSLESSSQKIAYCRLHILYPVPGVSLSTVSLESKWVQTFEWKLPSGSLILFSLVVFSATLACFLLLTRVMGLTPPQTGQERFIVDGDNGVKR